MSNNLIPANEVVIIKDIQVDEFEGLAVTSLEKGREKPEKGIVISVGTGKSPFGKQKIEPGDIVFYERYLDNRIFHQGNTYNHIRFNKILSIIKKS